MKGHTLLVLTSLLAAFAVALPGSAVATQGGTDRPVKGTLAGTTTANLATGTSLSQATGRISHLGRSTSVAEATFSVVGTLSTVSGTATVTAANGDQLFATFTGSGAVSSPIPAVGETGDLTLVVTITGGTGRFSDASGTLTQALHQEIVAFNGATIVLRDTATLRGRISY